jgi:hypothetical protein
MVDKETVCLRDPGPRISGRMLSFPLMDLAVLLGKTFNVSPQFPAFRVLCNEERHANDRP